MAKWNFFVSNTSLIKELDTSGNDVNPQSQSFLAPTLDLQGDKIVFKDNGSYKTAIMFPEIGEIDGVNPSDLQDAYDKIIAIIPNSGGGGGSETLQQVTDNGNTTTNDITAGGFLSLGNANIPGINFNDAEDLDTSLGFLGADPSITTPRNWVLPDTSGTIALASNIPTVDATPTDGSSNAVSSNGVFDGLALKQDVFTYVPIKSIVADYVTSAGVTGTASETLISSYKINANTLSALDFMNMTLRLLKTGTTAGYLITIRIGTTSTFSTSLTQIAQYGNTLSTGVDVNFQRYFKIEGGSLKSSNFTYNILANQGVSVNSDEGSTSFNVSVDNWIFISVKPQNSNSDVITQSIFKITN